MTGSRTFTFIARETNYQDSVPAAFTYVAQTAAPSFITPTSTNNGPLLITVAAGDTNGGVFRLTDPFNNVQSAAATNGAAAFAINAGAAYTLCMTRTGWSQSPSVTNNYYFVMTDPRHPAARKLHLFPGERVLHGFLNEHIPDCLLHNRRQHATASSTLTRQTSPSPSRPSLQPWGFGKATPRKSSPTLTPT